MEESEQLKETLVRAYEMAKDDHKEYCTPEHLLLAALEDKTAYTIIKIAGGDIKVIRNILKNVITNAVPDTGNDVEPEFSLQYENALYGASMTALSASRETVGVDDLLVNIYDLPDSWSSYALESCGVTRINLLEAITTFRRDTGNYTITTGKNIVAEENLFSDDESDSEEDSELPDDLPDEFNPFLDEDEARFGTNLLEKFTTNLTEKARKGELDPLVGRHEELERTIQVLCRRRKNNPLHVGDPGVGKTAVTEGLAQLIVKGQVPEVLKDCEVYSMEVGNLVAGTTYRGDFEERLRRLTNELLEKKNAILFIDEIHTIVGAGNTSGSSLDAANMLKPLLTSGKIKCIGSTTFEEYTKFFEKDRALSRRFQKIDILEPSKKDTLEILKQLAPYYSDFHKVSYSEEVLEEAINLSSQYLPERRLPDKAIDIIDEAGAWLRMHNKEADSIPVTEATIRMVTSKMAGVPLEDVTESEVKKLKELEATLKKKIFGQDEAVKAVCMAVKKSRAGFRNPDKPEASFLFVGPTGVGKTELTKVLASTLGEKFLRYDMSEYQEKYAVSRLIGSAPGYVGYEEGGQLTEDVRKAHHAVILFDEIEKAHSSIYNVFLQIMDYGTLTDNQGRKADFRNCIIIFTSNAGASELASNSIGFDSGLGGERNSNATLNEAVSRTFTPEFRNRLDAVISFNHIGKEIVSDIVKKEISLVVSRLLEKNVTLEVTDEVVSLIAEVGYSREFGARNISRTVEEKISLPLVDEVLFGKLSAGGKVKALRKGDEIEFVY